MIGQIIFDSGGLGANQNVSGKLGMKLATKDICSRHVVKTQTLRIDSVIKYMYASLWAHKHFFHVRHKAVPQFMLIPLCC